jgi:hypothetical protein
MDLRDIDAEIVDSSKLVGKLATATAVVQSNHAKVNNAHHDSVPPDISEEVSRPDSEYTQPDSDAIAHDNQSPQNCVDGLDPHAYGVSVSMPTQHVEQRTGEEPRNTDELVASHLLDFLSTTDLKETEGGTTKRDRSSNEVTAGDQPVVKKARTGSGIQQQGDVPTFASPGDRSKDQDIEPIQVSPLSSFPLELPVGRPVPLQNKHNLCYSNATIQAIYASVKPEWLAFALTSEHLGPPSTFSIDPTNNLWACVGETTKAKLSQFNPVTDFVKMLHDLQMFHATNDAQEKANSFYRPVGFQCSFARVAGRTWSGETQEDPAEYFRKICDMLSAGHRFMKSAAPAHAVVDSLFRVRNISQFACGHESCKARWNSSTIDEDWLLTLHAPAHIKSTPRASVTVTELLKLKAEAEDREGFRCRECHSDQKMTTAWTGLETLPKILVIQFDRIGDRKSDEKDKYTKLRYRVMIETELSIGLFGSRKLGVCYQLRTIIKHSGPKITMGHYIAFMRTQEGWWCCDDEEVESARPASLKNKTDGGDIYLAFYQKVEENKEDGDGDATGPSPQEEQ